MTEVAIVETVGIKESKEMLVGVMEVALICLEKFRDGVQIGDFVDIYDSVTKDEAFKAKLLMAFEGYSKIPDELSDLDTAEMVELAICLLTFLPKITKSLKKTDPIAK